MANTKILESALPPSFPKNLIDPLSHSFTHSAVLPLSDLEKTREEQKAFSFFLSQHDVRVRGWNFGNNDMEKYKIATERQTDRLHRAELLGSENCLQKSSITSDTNRRKGNPMIFLIEFFCTVLLHTCYLPISDRLAAL